MAVLGTTAASPGRALVVIVEGLPAGLPVTHADISDELARRRLGYERPPHALRAGRRHDRGRCPPRAHPGIAGGDRGGQHRVVPLRPLARGDGGRARRDQGAPHPTPARPRRPGRHAVRLPRRPRRAGAGLGPRDGGPGGGRRPGQSLLGHLGVQIVSHVVQLGSVRSKAAERPARRPRAGRRLGPALLRPGGRGGHGRRGQGRVQGRRQPRRGGRGPRLRRARRPRQPRPLGPAARRPAGPGAHEHPGRQGRRGRRRLRRGRPAGSRARPHHLPGTPGPAPTGATPAGPAASRAASRPASWWCARWR